MSTNRIRGRKSAVSHRRAGTVLCLRNDGYEVSLEPRKIYETVQDADAAAHGQMRVIDESGEAYLYPASYFAAIDLTPAVRRALLSSA